MIMTGDGGDNSSELTAVTMMITRMIITMILSYFSLYFFAFLGIRENGCEHQTLI